MYRYIGGFYAGIVSAIYAFAYFDLEYAFGVFVERFQTLIAGTLALVGAAITILLFLERRKRDANRAKATLAYHLNAVVEYSRQCMVIAQTYEGLLLSDRNDSGPDAPTLSDRHIHSLGDAAADTSGETAASLLDVLNTYQVQNARLLGLIERYRVPNIGNVSRVPHWKNAYECIEDAARLYEKTNRIFESARGDWNYNSGVTKERIERIIRFQLGLH